MDHGRERLKTLHVERKSENIYLMIENDLFDFKLSYGTEFETRLHKDGTHEMVEITKDSGLHMRCFSLKPKYPFSLFEKLRAGFKKRGWLWEEKHFSGFLNVPVEDKDKVDATIKELIGISLPEVIRPEESTSFLQANERKEEKVVARFPNGLTQVELTAGVIDGNKFLILDKSKKPVVEERFSGVVYLNRSEFEVYKDFSTISGILHLKTGVNWDAETPREKFQQAYAAFRSHIKDELERFSSSCICTYPRIVDYITERTSIDAELIRAEVNKLFFVQFDKKYDGRRDIHLLLYKCKHCSSSFQRSYRERGIDSLETLTIVPQEKIGKNKIAVAPTYLTALYGRLFSKRVFLGRDKLHAATMDEVLRYLFEKNE